MATTFPTTVDTASTLYTAVNGIATALNGGINNSVGTITVTDTTSFPTIGYIVIDTEVISYTGKTGTTFTGCGRGADGTAAAAHLTGVAVNASVIADHHNANMNAIIAIEQNISDRLGMGSTDIVKTFATAGSTSLFHVKHTNNANAASHSEVRVETGGASGGDAFTRFYNNVVSWSIGLDNSDSDALCITAASTLNGTNLTRITSAGGFQIQGTTTNDSATAGFVGEVIQSVESSPVTAPATTEYGNVTSISLTAGDWLVSAMGNFDGGTTITQLAFAISIYSGNTTTDHVTGSNVAFDQPNTATNDKSIAIPSYHLQLAATTTVYMKERADYTGTAPRCRGRISAVRIR